MPNPRPQATIYTDGACIGNPGPGGYAAVIKQADATREFSGGYRLTHIHRMELIAAIVGLAMLEVPCRVKLLTDSQYVANGGAAGGRVFTSHADLWAELRALLEIHDADFIKASGHSEIAGNGGRMSYRAPRPAPNAL